jgi:hypothetical protein
MEQVYMPATPLEFPASYDRSARIISTAFCLILLIAAVVVRSYAVGAASLFILALAYAYSPRSYAISDRTIFVRRWIGSARIPLEHIREARRVTDADLRSTIRLWGSGGAFGYYGLFRTSKLGNCSWYVTNRQNAVLVITDRKTALFSPDDVNGFLAAVGAGVADSETRLEPRPATGSTAKWVGAAVGAVGVSLTAAALLYSPGPPAYTLTSQQLVIHDRFYPVTLRASDVDIAAVRLVDIATDEQWRPTARTNGFANSHYRAGWFRVAGGRTVRLYRTDATRLVLIPPKRNGAPVLLEVTGPEQFLEELRRQWTATGPA